MIRTIIQQCLTGLGDCVTGYVSIYLLKQVLKIRYGTDVHILIDWNNVNSCPYINREHLVTPINCRELRRSRKIVCLYSGTDGTDAFRGYYQSNRFVQDVKTKTAIHILINQYIGKVLIDDVFTKKTIENWTYDAYQYVWSNVFNHQALPQYIREIPNTGIDYCAIYTRIGDQYLCQNDSNEQIPFVEQIPLTALYRSFSTTESQLPMTELPVALVGDVDQPKLTKAFDSLYNVKHMFTEVQCSHVAHSTGRCSLDNWNQIFFDLYVLLYGKRVIVLTNDSNFPRMVIFLRNINRPELYYKIGDHLQLINDPSTVFAKHYTF